MDEIKTYLVQSFEDCENFLRWMGERHDGGIGLDTEGTGYHLMDKLRLVQFGDKRTGWAIPYEDWKGVVKTALERYRGTLILHNAPHDLGALIKDGIKPFHHWSQVRDTVPSCHLKHSMQTKKLKDACALYVDSRAKEGQSDLKKYFARTGKDWATVDVRVPEYWIYGALDAVLPCWLDEALADNTSLYPEAYDLEMAVLKVIMNMELNGVRIDVDYVQNTLEDQIRRRSELLPPLRDVGIVINNDDDSPSGHLDSKNIIKIFNKMGCEVPYKPSKKSAKPSVDDDVLSRIYERDKVDEHGIPVQHPVADQLQELRKIQLRIKTYFEKMLEMRDGDRLHPSINPLEARSGRMSITEPNMSGLAKDAEVRDAVIPEEGNKILLVDFQNEELRIIGSLCKSKGMIEAFEQGVNMHRRTASRAWGVPEEEVTENMYTKAKRSMFTFGYGGRAKKFTEYVGEMGTSIYNELHAGYPEVQEYMDDGKKIIQETKGKQTSDMFTHQTVTNLYPSVVELQSTELHQPDGRQYCNEKVSS